MDYIPPKFLRGSDEMQKEDEQINVYALDDEEEWTDPCSEDRLLEDAEVDRLLADHCIKCKETPEYYNNNEINCIRICHQGCVKSAWKPCAGPVSTYYQQRPRQVRPQCFDDPC